MPAKAYKALYEEATALYEKMLEEAAAQGKSRDDVLHHRDFTRIAINLSEALSKGNS